MHLMKIDEGEFVNADRVVDLQLLPRNLMEDTEIQRRVGSLAQFIQEDGLMHEMIERGDYTHGVLLRLKIYDTDNYETIALFTGSEKECNKYIKNLTVVDLSHLRKFIEKTTCATIIAAIATAIICIVSILKLFVKTPLSIFDFIQKVF